MFKLTNQPPDKPSLPVISLIQFKSSLRASLGVAILPPLHAGIFILKLNILVDCIRDWWSFCGAYYLDIEGKPN